MKKIAVKITFTDEVLGTTPSSREIFSNFIASNAPDAKSRDEEIEMMGVQEVIKQSMTVFPKDKKGNPLIINYQMKGFFKDTCAALAKCEGYQTYEASKAKGSDLRAYKKMIDGTIFVFPRYIPIKLSGKMGKCERSLRGWAGPAQGEKVALANSETVPIGSTCEFEVHCLNEKMVKYVIEWLEYGVYRGFGQWRNSGKGTFDCEIKQLKPTSSGTRVARVVDIQSQVEDKQPTRKHHGPKPRSRLRTK